MPDAFNSNRAQRLRFRIWWHIGLSVLFVAAAIYCAIQRLIVPAILLIAITGVWVWIIKRSTDELSRLRETDDHG